jgi:hypothetical protein
VVVVVAVVPAVVAVAVAVPAPIVAAAAVVVEVAVVVAIAAVVAIVVVWLKFCQWLFAPLESSRVSVSVTFIIQEQENYIPSCWLDFNSGVGLWVGLHYFNTQPAGQ